MAATSDVQLYMRYLTRFLQVGGMYVSFETKQRWRYLQCLYCVIMSLLQVANFIRLSVILLKELTLSANMMTVLASWCSALWTAYQLPAVAIASSKYMHNFVTELSSYFDRYDNEAKLGRATKCLKRLFIVIIVLWFLQACVFMTVNLTSSPAVISSRVRFLYPFTELSDVPHYIGVSACSLVVTYSSYASIAAYIFFIATARLVAKEFVQINKLVREMVDSEMVNEQCESLRRRHAHLCEMLTTGNKIVSHILFPCFTTQIPTLCCLLFGVIRGTLPPEGQTLSIYVIGAGLLNLFSTLFVGAYVTSAAHSSLDSLFLCDLSKLADKTVQTVSLFVSRLQGPTIGFTVHGLFTVDASAILMVIGTLFTYAIVMLQLTPAADTMDAVNQTMF